MTSIFTLPQKLKPLFPTRIHSLKTILKFLCKIHRNLFDNKKKYFLEKLKIILSLALLKIIFSSLFQSVTYNVYAP